MRFVSSLASATALVLALVTAQPAAAHFVWVDVEGGKARVMFSEDGQPGEAHLIGKIAVTKLTGRPAGGAAKALETKEAKSGDTAWLEAAWAGEGDCSLEAVCNYGVIARDGKSFLLQYYAKHLRAAKATDLDAVATSKGLPLDLVPAVKDGAVQLTVLWNGKPQSGVEIHALGPDNKPQELSTDKAGQVTLKGSASGAFVIRAKHVEDKAGERGDKKYTETRHYSTLTLALGKSEPVAADAALTATQLLAKARAARAIWDEFPGFTADLTVTIDGKVEKGQARLSADGEPEIRLPEGAANKWITRAFGQLVEHRMPSGFGEERAEYVDDDLVHPLGRLIRLNDKELGSVYRVRGDVVTEVNRKMGSGKFTISVVEVHRNPDKKYLPKVFTVTFWDEAGAVQSSVTSLHEWKRVGAVDLPSHMLEVTASPGKREVRQAEFSNVKLLDPKKTAAK